MTAAFDAVHAAQLVAKLRAEHPCAAGVYGLASQIATQLEAAAKEIERSNAEIARIRPSESNEGHPTGPYSDILRCHLGGGCHECGGIGAAWHVVDDEALADHIREAP